MTDEPEKPETREEELHRIRTSNLRPAPAWEPGQSGNPKGKPRGTLNRSTILKKYMEATFKTDKGETKPQPFGLEGDHITVAEAVDLALLKRALGGNMDAIREIKDSIFGKHTELHQFSGIDGGPIETANKSVNVSAPATAEEAARAYAELLKKP